MSNRIYANTEAQHWERHSDRQSNVFQEYTLDIEQYLGEINASESKHQLLFQPVPM
jgi:hypothetical protein